MNWEFHVRHHHDATSSIAGVSGSHQTHHPHRSTPANNSPTAATPASDNMAQRFRWHPAPVGGAPPVAAAAPAPAPNNPWTNPSHPTARATMAAAPAVAANNPGVARWDPVPVATAAPDAAPNTGHHRRWHPAPVAAAAAPTQHIHYPVVAAPNNPWNHFAPRPHYGVYPEVHPVAFPTFVAFVLASVATHFHLQSLISPHRHNQHQCTTLAVGPTPSSTAPGYEGPNLSTIKLRMALGLVPYLKLSLIGLMLIFPM